jgi:predicted O-methyltransferase YrrM
MSKTVELNEALYQYLWRSMDRESELLRRLREETASLPMSMMQIAPDQGQFMALLARLMDARRVLEVGTFTGYSALVMALAMAEDSYTLCCDVSMEWTAIAQRYWREAGVDHKIALKLQPALQTLDEQLAEGAAGSYDMMFIDADKENYPHYYERGLALLRRGGLMLVDNVLWGGSVIDDSKQDVDTVAIRELNAALQCDERIDLSMLPVGDGLTLVRKR